MKRPATAVALATISVLMLAATPCKGATPTTPPDDGDGIGMELYVRANLLRWATLTPDVGIEVRADRSWGLLVNGSWTSWSRNNADRRYALWEVAPEFRWYLGRSKRGYVGVMYKFGSFNYKL